MKLCFRKIISILFDTKKNVLCVENKLQDGGQRTVQTTKCNANTIRICKSNLNLPRENLNCFRTV